MAVFPVGLAFLVMVPDPSVVHTARAQAMPEADSAVVTAAFASQPAKVLATTPPVPRTSLPFAVDRAGKVYEPVVPAIYEEPVSADDEARPSPQSPRGVTTLPALAPAPSASPEPSA